MSHSRKKYFLALLVPLLVLMWLQTAAANSRSNPTVRASLENYDVGAPVLADLWVNPVSGNNANSGATRAQALRTISEAWSRIPQGATLSTTGYRILLVAGDYGEENFPLYWEQRYGTFTFPIIIQSADAPRSARLHGFVNVYDTRYFYFLDLTLSNPGDVFHCELCNHILIRNSALSGGNRQAHETIKMNQSQYIYIEDSDVAESYENPIDFVAVQYGAITNNKIHAGDDWCMYLKGGSAYFRIEGNEIYDCGTGGFTMGQGTGFEYMTTPWLHYETFDLKFVNNIIHDTDGACFGANGAYNGLFAYNTCYRVGSRSHAIEIVFGARGCDGDTARCNANHNAGGWGSATSTDEPIPNRNVFIYNNMVYNPAGFQSQWSHFAIYGPRTPSAGSNIPSPARTDTNLQMRGNLIWNGPSDHSLGIEDGSQGCRPSNSTCNETQLRADNSINAVEPQLLDPAHGNFRPVSGGNVFGVTTYALPDFTWTDAPAAPGVPAGTLSNAVATDRDGAARTSSGPPGAYLNSIAQPTNTPTHTPTPNGTPVATSTATPTSPPECTEKPLAPVPVSPAKGAALKKRRVPLVWQAAACADNYSVQVRQDTKKGARVVLPTTVFETTFTTRALAKGHKYFWQVQACNAHGCTASAWRTFFL